MYQIRIGNQAKKSLKKLQKNKNDLAAIVEAIDSLESDPFTNAETIQSRKNYPLPVLRRRVGNYRIVYTVNKTEVIVEIVAIGNRQQIYKIIENLF